MEPFWRYSGGDFHLIKSLPIRWNTERKKITADLCKLNSTKLLNNFSKPYCSVSTLFNFQTKEHDCTTKTISLNKVLHLYHKMNIIKNISTDFKRNHIHSKKINNKSILQQHIWDYLTMAILNATLWIIFLHFQNKYSFYNLSI